MNRGITKAYTAGGAITRRRIVKWSADFTVVQAAAATDALAGIADGSSDTVSGGRVDVHKTGIVDVEYGATVAAGAPLTSDAVGRAIVAAPAAGVNMRIIGFAEVAGVVGDIGLAWIEPGLMQG